MLKSNCNASKEKNDELKDISYISVEKIRANPNQPRKEFNTSSLEELCDSIKEYGVIQPINVRKISFHTYELISGERRLRAAQMAGLKAIPAIINNVNENDSAVIALIENLQRQNLTYLDEAEGYKILINEFDFTQVQLAKKIGKTQSSVANKIRLLKLPKSVLKILTDRVLSERHARALLILKDEQLQLRVLKQVCDHGLNVRNTEELVEKELEKSINIAKNHEQDRKITKPTKDIKIFVSTIRQTIDLMKKSGVDAKAAQIDRGKYVEFIVRIPKSQNLKG